MNNEDRIIVDIPAFKVILSRLNAIETKLDELGSIILESHKVEGQTTSPKRMMTLREVAEVYGMSLATLRNKASRRQIPLTRISNRLYVDTADFEEWLAEKKIKVYD